MDEGQPWYQKGLRFECSQCGDCCRGPGFVWVDVSEIASLAGFLEISEETFARTYLRRVSGRTALTDNSRTDCIFWDQGCTVYPARPRQCRTFPFWDSHLENAQAWDRITTECPGAGEGRNYSLAEIVALRQGSASTDGGAERRNIRRPRT
jgi:Fe-S-cluster containining protein